jgi:putative GTP pyrophosphokinase
MEDNKTPILKNISYSDLMDMEHPELLLETMEPFNRLLMMYRCASMEIETKLKVLNEEFSLHHNRNPIETIKTRIKSPLSILEKTKRKNIPFTIEGLEQNMFDIAGIRVICAFPEDIYTVRNLLLKQDDVTLFMEKDYIKNPKPNGYRSLHLIVEVPIFLAEEKRPMKVEVQLRTIAMDCWASLDHKLKYKQNIENADDIAQKLKKCADISSELDLRMQEIRRDIDLGSV